MTSKQLIQQKNHPQPGSVIKVDPIKTVEEIRKVRSVIKNLRDQVIFTVGINTNFRAGDLLGLRVGQVRGVKVGEHFRSREQKTGKLRMTTLNKASHDAIKSLLKTMPDATDGDFLFQSRLTKQALTVSALNSMVKTWCFRGCISQGNYGSHTLRKTFAHFHYFYNNVPAATLREMLNHSSDSQTLAYISVQPEYIKDAYLKEVG